MKSLNDLWQAVCEEIKTKIADVGYNTWIAVITPVSMSDSTFILSVPTVFQRDILLQHYAAHIKNAFEVTMGFPVEFTVISEDESKEKIVTPANIDNSTLTGNGYTYTFDTFIVGSCNRFAHAASLAVAENPAVTYNPLFIWGDSGVGKTHLLQAILNHINEKSPEKSVLYCRSEDFTNNLINAIREGTTSQFHDMYRECDVLLMDDIQFIAGKDSTQEEFFNTFNALYHSQKQVVLTSDRPPKDIKILDQRLKSRFEMGLIADIQPPDYETRVGIINRKANLLGLTLSENHVYFIAEHIKMNTRQLEGVVKKLQAITMLQQETISIGVIQDVIRDIRNDDRAEPITVEKIIDEVSRSYGITSADIRSGKRDSAISNARQSAMYIIREITNLPMKNIGAEFNRDHSTVVYALKECEKKMKSNRQEREIIEDIINNLKNDL